MMCDGNLLRTHRAGIRFDDIPTDALDVAALRGPMGHGTCWLVSMVGDAVHSSRDGASRDALGRCSRLQRHDYVLDLGAIRDDACGRARTTDVYRCDPGEFPRTSPTFQGFRLAQPGSFNDAGSAETFKVFGDGWSSGSPRSAPSRISVTRSAFSNAEIDYPQMI